MAYSERVETMDYAAMMRRMVRTYGERVADGDPEDLADMLGVAKALDAAIAAAVRSMREDRGLSWAEVARGAGTTRQAAQQRWGRRTFPSDT